MSGPQTHHMQCLVQDERFKGVDCDEFDNPKPKTMALSVLVVIEICNALNRYQKQNRREPTHRRCTALRHVV